MYMAIHIHVCKFSPSKCMANVLFTYEPLQLLLLLLRLRLLILRHLVQLLVQLICRLAIPQKHQHKLGVHLPRYKCSPH